MPAPAADEVLVEVETASVCGTDLHIYGWDEWSQGRIVPPLTLGHEFAGTVVESGRARPQRLGRRLRLGREPHHLRRLLPVPHRPRAHVRAHADPRRRPRRRLRALRGRARVGDLAERPRRSCRPRSRRSRSRSATPSSRRASRISPAARSPCSAAARSGCSRSGSPAPPAPRSVIAADRTPFRLGLAEKMGASDVVNVDETPDTAAGSSSRTRARLRRRLRDVGLAARDRRRVPDRAQRRPRDPVRDPVAAGRDRRRRGADLQEPERARR